MIVIKEHARITDNVSCYNIYNLKTNEYIQELIPKKDIDEFKMMLGVADTKIIKDPVKLPRSKHFEFYQKIRQ